MADAPIVDPFRRLREATPARIGLGRAGQALPTAPMLAFQLAHARARDAVDAALDVEAIAAAFGRPVLVVESAARDREPICATPTSAGAWPRVRPSRPATTTWPSSSRTASRPRRRTSMARRWRRRLLARLDGWSVAPIVLARQGRVALGDPIASALGARAVVVLIGERPGLSTPHSLSAYLTWAPRPGRLDSERNCVSNIHEPHGLSAEQAADKIAWAAERGAAAWGSRASISRIDTSSRLNSAPSTPPRLTRQ